MSKPKKRIVPTHITDELAAASQPRTDHQRSVYYDSFLDQLDDTPEYYDRRARELGYEDDVEEEEKEEEKEEEPVRATVINAQPVAAIVRNAPVQAAVVHAQPVAAKVLKARKGRSSGPGIIDRPRADQAVLADEAEPGPVVRARVVENGKKCAGTDDQGNQCPLDHEDGSLYCRRHKYSSIIVAEKCRYQGCRRVTTKTFYCPEHLKEEYDVEIKPSAIAGAGDGLFALRAFRKGEQIVPYTGDVIVTNDKDFGDDYALQVKKRPPTFISARRTNTGPGRYANARIRSRGQGSNNAQLVYNPRKKEAWVRAGKPIKAGEEITVPYGSGYWKAHENEASSSEAESEEDSETEDEEEPDAVADPAETLREMFDWLGTAVKGVRNQKRLGEYRQQLL